MVNGSKIKHLKSISNNYAAGGLSSWSWDVSRAAGGMYCHIGTKPKLGKTGILFGPAWYAAGWPGINPAGGMAIAFNCCSILSLSAFSMSFSSRSSCFSACGRGKELKNCYY